MATIVRKDVNFLSTLGLMDYSLLLAIETIEEEEGRADSMAVH